VTTHKTTKTKMGVRRISVWWRKGSAEEKGVSDTPEKRKEKEKRRTTFVAEKSNDDVVRKGN
jgi:hypothetical protein